MNTFNSASSRKAIAEAKIENLAKHFYEYILKTFPTDLFGESSIDGYVSTNILSRQALAKLKNSKLIICTSGDDSSSRTYRLNMICDVDNFLLESRKKDPQWSGVTTYTVPIGAATNHPDLQRYAIGGQDSITTY